MSTIKIRCILIIFLADNFCVSYGHANRKGASLMKRDSNDPLARAINLAHGQQELARVLGISSASIAGWKRCPPKRVLSVEMASGVSRHDLRPDLYPREEK
jgi:hypothetical protein